MQNELQELVQKNKQIFRDCHTENLSEDFIVYKFISFADMDEIQQLVNILGKQRVAKIFKKLITNTERVDFSPRIINFFTILFDLENEVSLSDIIARAKANSYFHR